ncbi:MAG: hypothetical protein RKP46_07060, partial [Candidatus Accumulibacter sp.]|uniref:hypothetical protein n=1 Tax=Accumulibacter sp. TaxID=2053492 RepID=UPI002878BD9C
NLYLTLRRRVHCPLCYEEVGAYCSPSFRLAPFSWVAAAGADRPAHAAGSTIRQVENALPALCRQAAQPGWGTSSWRAQTVAYGKL